MRLPPLISKETASRFHAITHAKSDWAYRYFIEGVDKNGKPRSPAGVIPKKYHYLLDAPFKISNRCCNYLKKEPANRYEKETGRNFMEESARYRNSYTIILERNIVRVE